MKSVLVAILTLAIVGFSSMHAGAHDGGHPPELRTWKDADGHLKIEGSFVTARDGQVHILPHDGPTVWVPLDELCEADRAWVQKRVDKIHRLNGVIPTAAMSAPVTETLVSNHPSTNTIVAVGSVVLFGLLALVVVKASTLRRGVTVTAAILVTGTAGVLAIAPDTPSKPAIQTHFEPFKDKLKFRSDDKWFYVESNGMPDHPMMVGITAWQQQVPIPQAYTGRNAWQIPLSPKLSDKPVSAKQQLFRGAIALAANGVPIFNPIKNDGKTDTYIAGELDAYGGHCGRGDDYHYHIAPIHLEKVVGKGNPIGYALDGFPLYGYTDAAGKEPKDLDEFNGRMEKDGYRYYSTKKYPYVNGGLRGVVTIKDDQIDPQPRAYSPRAALTPLRGAKITEFERDDAQKSVTVKYMINGQTGSVKYTASAEKYDFQFTDTTGKVTNESYPIREDGKRPPPKKDGPGKKDGPKKDDRPPVRKDNSPQPTEHAPMPNAPGSFKLTSPAFDANGKYPAEFTGDGAGISPPLKWSGAPTGTKFYALQLWHKPKPDGDEVKSYWVISNIPATVTSLDKNSKGVGKDGFNDKRRTGYDPMNSKGPGPKEYHITLYALSAEPKFDNDKFARADLLKAIKEITLAETTLSYTYERKAKP